MACLSRDSRNPLLHSFTDNLKADNICGSWVVDAQTSEILGPIVAGSENLGETFVLPIKNVLGSVQEKYTASSVHFPTKTDSLWLAAYFGNTSVVSRLLKALGSAAKATINAPFRGPCLHQSHTDELTMLHWAAWKGFREICEALIAAGGDFKSRTKSMKTPLHFASSLSTEEAFSSESKVQKLHIIAFLIVQEGIDVNAKDAEGNTPLRIAADTGFTYAKDLLKRHSKKESTKPSIEATYPTGSVETVGRTSGYIPFTGASDLPQATRPEWQWDVSRRSWCYWDPTQQSWVYENQTNDVSRTDDERDQDNYGVSTTVEGGTPEQVTEPGALRSGIRAWKRVSSRPGDIERLDPRECNVMLDERILTRWLQVM